MVRTVSLLKFSALPGKRDELVTTFLDEAEHMQSESGVDLFLVHTDPADPDAVWLYVAFASEADEEGYTRGVAGNQVMNRTDLLAPAPPQQFALVSRGGKGIAHGG